MAAARLVRVYGNTGVWRFDHGREVHRAKTSAIPLKIQTSAALSTKTLQDKQMKLLCIVLVALVVAASALPVSDDLDLPDLLTDDTNEISDLQASVRVAQQASEKQTSEAMANILLQQTAQESDAASAMQAAAIAQDNHVSPTGTTDLSLSVGNDFVRANAALSQYTFSSCHGGDAPGNGHCRPQIDSPQVSWC